MYNNQLSFIAQEPCEGIVPPAESWYGGESLADGQPHAMVRDGFLWARHWVLEMNVPKTV